jgi:PGF-pre-PGF domain-containing protein
MTFTTKRRLAVISTLLVVAAALSVGGAAMVSAQDLPAGYYGDVEIEGEPASDGIEVIASVNGEDRDSLTVEDGSYGGSGSTEEKLLVQGDDIESGDEVTFYVDGDGIERTEVDSTDPSTVEWSAGEIQQVDLTVDAVEEIDDGGDGNGGGGGGGGGGAPAQTEEPQEPASISTSVTGTNPTISVDEGISLSSVGFGSQTDIDAEVEVNELTESPSPEPDGSTFVTGADITFTSGDSSGVERVRIGVRQSRLAELDVSSDRLVVAHLNEDSGEWELLDTTVESEDDEQVVLDAPSAGFSTYAVFAQEEPTTTATDTPEPDTDTPEPGTDMPEPDTDTPEPGTDTPEPDGGPGPVLIGGLVIVVLAIAAGAYLALGRE